jgi:hypothetical protein
MLPAVCVRRAVSIAERDAGATHPIHGGMVARFVQRHITALPSHERVVYHRTTQEVLGDRSTGGSQRAWSGGRLESL